MQLHLRVLTSRAHKRYVINDTTFFQVIIKAIFIVSYVGNRGTFEHNVRWLLSDRNLVLHLMYFTFGVLGFAVHTFFYSILVSVHSILVHVYSILVFSMLVSVHLMLARVLLTLHIV